MQKIRVANVCAKHPADDKRVYDKLSITLIERGYEVHNTSPNILSTVTKDGVNLHGFEQKPGFLNRLLSLRGLYKLCVRIHPDAMLAHEPDALVVAYLYYSLNRKRQGVRLIFDCHEAYEYWFTGKLGFPLFEKLINSFVVATINGIVRRIDGVTSVNQTMTDRFAKMNKNSHMIPSVTASECTAGINQQGKNYNVAFFGYFGHSRQKSMLLEATDILKQKGVECSIGIIGGEHSGNNNESFEELVSRKGLSDYFVFHGWLPREQAFEQLRLYGVGMMRFDSYTMPGNYALPNKMFEYMANGLGVLACEKNIEVGAIIRENKCGLLIPDETGESLADALQYIKCHPEKVIQWQKNALLASQLKYNWEIYGDVLESVVREI